MEFLESRKGICEYERTSSNSGNRMEWNNGQVGSG